MVDDSVVSWFLELRPGRRLSLSLRRSAIPVRVGGLLGDWNSGRLVSDLTLSAEPLSFSSFCFDETAFLSPPGIRGDAGRDVAGVTSLSVSEFTVASVTSLPCPAPVDEDTPTVADRRSRSRLPRLPRR